MTTSTLTPDPSRVTTIVRRTIAITGATMVLVTTSAARAFADGPFIPVKPDPNAPGLKGLGQAVAWLASYAMYAAMGAAVLSVIALFVGKAIGEHRMVQGGKTGLLVTVVGAFALGILATVLNAAYNAGAQG